MEFKQDPNPASWNNDILDIWISERFYIYVAGVRGGRHSVRAYQHHNKLSVRPLFRVNDRTVATLLLMDLIRRLKDEPEDTSVEDFTKIMDVASEEYGGRDADGCDIDEYFRKRREAR